MKKETVLLNYGIYGFAIQWGCLTLYFGIALSKVTRYTAISGLFLVHF
jgi:hypothetical protein